MSAARQAAGKGKGHEPGRTLREAVPPYKTRPTAAAPGAGRSPQLCRAQPRLRRAEPRRRRAQPRLWRRWAGRAPRTAGATLLYVYTRQAQLLYQPHASHRTLAPTPGAIDLEYDDLRIETSDGVALHAWLIPAGAGAGAGARARAGAGAGAGRPVVLFCHGNAGSIADRLDTVRLLHGLDLHVLMFDYRGYGQSTGRPSESGTYRDAEAAWRYLVEECRFAPREIILFGRSLGAAIAAHHFWYLPVRYLARFRYSTLDYIRCVDAPTLVIHSAEDDVVPIEQGRKI